MSDNFLRIVLFCGLLLSGTAVVGEVYQVGKDGAFSCIQDAADAMKAGDVCLVGEGVYRETVTPRSSEVVFRAVDGEKVMVSGADVLRVSWEKHEGNVFKAKTDKRFVQLFVDGAMMNEARWPNIVVNGQDPGLLDKANWARAEGGDERHVFDSDLPGGDWRGAILNIVGGSEWISYTRRVVEYEAGKGLKFDAITPANGHESYAPRKGNPYCLFGALAGLDAPGEWFLDEAVGMVYLWTADGRSPAEHLVEVKRRGYAFDLKSRDNVRIEGFDVFAAALNIQGVGCVVDDCHLRYVNHFREAAVIHEWPIATPNVMAGRNNQWRNCTIAHSAGDGIKVHGDGNMVTNCVIRDVGYTGVYAACINSAMVEEGQTTNARFTHNTMYNSGRFIVFHHAMKDSVIQYNHMFNTGLLTKDSGITYSHATWGTGCDFSYNWAHGSTSVAGCGLYLDETTAPHDIHHNLIWNVIFGFQININNNATIKPPYSQSFNHFYNNTIDVAKGHSYAACITNNGDNGKFINNVVRTGDGMVWRRDKWHQWTFREWWRAAHPEPEDGLARVNEIARHNRNFRLDAFYYPLAGSAGVDAGEVLEPFTDGYVGKAPDIGAYEYGGDYWLPGSTLDSRSLFSYLPGEPVPVRGAQMVDSTVEVSFVCRMRADSFGEARIDGGLHFGPARGDGTAVISLPIIGVVESDRIYTVTIPVSVRPVEGMRILDCEYVFRFSTFRELPKVMNLPARDVGIYDAVLQGKVVAGGERPEVTVFWGEEDGGEMPEKWGNSVKLVGQRFSEFSLEIELLHPQTTYYYRCFTKNSSGSVWAAESSSFTTLSDWPKGCYFRKGRRGRWAEKGNWSRGKLPGANDSVYLRDGANVSVDSAVPKIDVLFLARSFTKDTADSKAVLNIVNGGLLRVKGGGDWSYLGEGPSTATLNLSGNGRLVFASQPVLFHHSGTGRTVVNISDEAALVIRDRIEFWEGRSETNVAGGRIIAGDLVWQYGDKKNVIRISGAGVLLVRGENYSVAEAHADISAGRILGEGLSVSIVQIRGVDYTRIAGF